MPVDILLVDDDSAVTEGLTWLLASLNLPSRTFSSAEAFLEEARKIDRPACAVLDLRMAGMSGLALQQQLLSEGINLPLMFLSAHGDVRAAVHALQAGAIDFLEKPFKAQEFVDAVNRLMQIARERYQFETQERDLKERLKKLSGREYEVFIPIAEGRTSKEVAKMLNISPKTIDVHRATIIRKLDVKSTADLKLLYKKLCM